MEDFDVVFQHIGHFGIFQFFFFILIGILSIFHGYQVMGPNFMGFQEDHWCKVDGLQNYSFDTQRHVAIPFKAGSEEYDSCKVYDLPWDLYSPEEIMNWDRSARLQNASTIACSAWVYKREVFETTMITQWDLVCGKGWLVQMVSTAYMAGMLVGSILSGFLSDQFGRKPPCVAFGVLHPVFGLGAAFCPHIVPFLILRFLMAVCAFGAFMTGFVLLMEVIGPKYRALSNAFFQTFFSIGVVMLSLFGYFVRDVTKLQIVMNAPVLVCLGYWFVLPESPRWLAAKGRVEEARAVLHKIAKINRTHLPEDLNINIAEVKSEKGTEEVKKATVLDLFRYRALRRQTFIIYIVWFTNSLVYYGLSLNLGSLVGNVFLNNALMGMVSFPGDLVAFLGMQSIGRKITVAVAFLVIGVANLACMPIILANKALVLLTVFALIGKAASTTTFTGSFQFTAELYPTQIRQVAVGSASMVSRVSGMIAPYMGGPLQEVWKPLPSVIFGGFGILAGVVTFFLPETLNRKIPDTIEEAERIARKLPGDSYHEIKLEKTSPSNNSWNRTSQPSYKAVPTDSTDMQAIKNNSMSQVPA